MTFLVCVFLLVVLNSALSFSKSNIYLDNGLDQTSISGVLTRREKTELEIQILNVLGLPNRPTKTNRSLKKSTLKFLMELYNSLTIHDNEISHRKKRSADVDLSVEKRMAIEESDMIMTFDSISHHNHVRYQRGKSLWFNLSSMPIAEDVVGAELRIFQKKSDLLTKTKNLYTISVYEITGLKRHKLQFISSVNTTGSYTGWISLNLTSCLHSWVTSRNSNKGLYLAVRPNGIPGWEIRPDKIGLTISTENDETHPFLVAFLKNVQTIRTKRSVEAKPQKSPVSHYSTMMKSYQKYEPSKTICSKRTLYISFRDLGWKDWIIAPEGYSAYYCAGECKFPLTAHLNATSHALVQSWVHLKFPHKFPRPCCAPTELSPTYLIYQEADTAALKKRRDMIVESCGCM